MPGTWMFGASWWMFIKVLLLYEVVHVSLLFWQRKLKYWVPRALTRIWIYLTSSTQSQSVSQPVSQSVSRSVGRSVGRSVSQEGRKEGRKEVYFTINNFINCFKNIYSTIKNERVTNHIFNRWKLITHKKANSKLYFYCGPLKALRQPRQKFWPNTLFFYSNLYLTFLRSCCENIFDIVCIVSEKIGK